MTKDADRIRGIGERLDQSLAQIRERMEEIEERLDQSLARWRLRIQEFEEEELGEYEPATRSELGELAGRLASLEKLTAALALSQGRIKEIESSAQIVTVMAKSVEFARLRAFLGFKPPPRTGPARVELTLDELFGRLQHLENAMKEEGVKIAYGAGCASRLVSLEERVGAIEQARSVEEATLLEGMLNAPVHEAQLEELERRLAREAERIDDLVGRLGKAEGFQELLEKIKGKAAARSQERQEGLILATDPVVFLESLWSSVESLWSWVASLWTMVAPPGSPGPRRSPSYLENGYLPSRKPADVAQAAAEEERPGWGTGAWAAVAAMRVRDLEARLEEIRDGWRRDGEGGYPVAGEVATIAQEALDLIWLALGRRKDENNV